MKRKLLIGAALALVFAAGAIAQSYTTFSYARVLNILDVRTSIQNQDTAENVVVDDGLQVTGALSFGSCAGCGGVPGGSNTQVQFNDSSTFGGDAGLVYDKATDALTLGGQITIGTLDLVSSTGPVSRWNETDAAANNRVWDLFVNAEQLNLRVVNDALGSATNWLVVDRTANTVDNVNILATALQGNSVDMTPASGTFTASFDAACTTTPTAVFDYQRLGNIVSVWMVSTTGFTCTGDSTSFGTTGTPIPASIRPSSQDVCVPANTLAVDNGVSVYAGIVFSTTGDVSISRFGTTPGGCSSGTNWTASGTRTLGGTLSAYRATYGLGNP